MSKERYTGQYGITCDEILVGRIIMVHPITSDIGNPLDLRPICDVLPLDGRALYEKVPAGFNPGHIRNYRQGQTVLLGFRQSSANSPVIIGHIFNLETDPNFTDPVPSQYENWGDDVYYHPETGAFIRFRNNNSTPTDQGADGSPATVEMTLASGATMKFIEDGTGRCSYTLSMPSGAYVSIDDNGAVVVNSPTTMDIVATGNITITTGADLTANVTGDMTANVTGNMESYVDGAMQAHVTLDMDATVSGSMLSNVTGDITLVAGGTATVQAQGNVLVESVSGVINVEAAKVVIASSDIELGGDTSHATGNGLVRESDLAAITTHLASLHTQLAAHGHTNVQSGTASSGGPNVTFPTAPSPTASTVVFSE